ncbi:TIGR02453 family protein [Clostridium sp. MCC353]|uniref:DUF2461 domain-containing protein n=1 Tax=Clostridium sp. MCC353 TaxID=2592646 RepID=UPI001C02AB8C|nr:DUF2461 domain-containing protein [Clostridium sp. MCC353]MBT9775058.1 TIGR02453 family protein [Clostridium sp. MCC353]
MNTKLILDYLKDLEENNNQEWYHAHKEEYKQAYDEFLKVIEAFMMELGKMEPAVLEYEPKQLTFKLNRDTRFSKDKSPYNPSFRAHISSKGKLPVPVGWFLVLKPSGSFLGGGLFADMFKDATDRVRDYITAHGKEWEEIIENPEFKERFQVKGNALKNVPKGYDAAHPQAEYLKYKSWFLEYFMEDEQILDSEKFIEEALEACRIMKPFNDFLNRALDGFQMPSR